MRLKLLMIASLVAAVVGAAVTVVILSTAFGSLNVALAAKPFAHEVWVVVVQSALPLLIAALASMFVYRHTARRRKLQAALTLILSLLLVFGMQMCWLFLEAALHIKFR